VEDQQADRARHVPVMVSEVLAWLDPARGGTFVDCTVGLGGHTRALLDAGAQQVIGIDRDGSALALAHAALASFETRVTLVHGDYRDIVTE
jgi:16S rRNA (cytosine1402-N4)-methyltransferase